MQATSVVRVEHRKAYLTALTNVIFKSSVASVRSQTENVTCRCWQRSIRSPSSAKLRLSERRNQTKYHRCNQRFFLFKARFNVFNVFLLF